MQPIQLFSPWIYGKVYYILIALFTFSTMMKYNEYPDSRVRERLNATDNYVACIAISVILIIIIGLRPISGAFIDMMNYIKNFEMRTEAIVSLYNSEATNPIFETVLNFFVVFGLSPSDFFLTIATIYFSAICFACCKMFGKDAWYSLLVYLGAFSTFTYGTNGIKAGAAAAVFLVGVALYRKTWLSIIIILMTLWMHHSMIIPIIAYFAARYINKPRLYLAAWLICIMIAALHITIFQDIFANFADEGGQGYLTADENAWGGKTGFRIDFLIYSAIPVVIGYWTIFRRGTTSKFYCFLLCMYLFTNAIWMVCMYVPFNNRIAYLSWFLLPIVSIYPFLKLPIGDNQYKKLNLISFAFISFSLIMVFL